MKYFFIIVLLFAAANINYSQSSCDGISTVTYDNKIYNTVQIGDQCWLKENINVGTMINGLLDQTNNSVIEKYCYNNEQANCDIYGGLYTWEEAMKYSVSGSKVQGLCPGGWRLPNADELSTLKSFANDDGSALKDVTQGVGTSTGTNISGFSALLSGTRGAVRSNGSPFSHITVYGYFWSSTEYNPIYAHVLELGYNDNNILLRTNGKAAAFSLRCLKGEGTTAVLENSDRRELPTEFSLSQNYPNPFNPGTVISYKLPVACQVSLKVFDLLGREVATLVDEFQQAGNYNSQFLISNSKLTSGIYYYQMRAEGFVQTRKFILMK